MRFTPLVLLTALALAGPAAAQPEPDPAPIVLGALERAQQNVPSGVAGYLVNTGRPDWFK